MQNSTLLKVSVPDDKEKGWVTIDIAIPKSDETIRELIAGLVDHLRSEFVADGRKTTYFDGSEIRWSLSKGSVGAFLNPDIKLSDSGLVDGDRVYLIHESAREEFTKVLDDTSDAIASQLKNTYPEWDQSAAAQHIAKIIPVSMLILCIAASWTILSIPNVAWFVPTAVSIGFALVSVLGLVYALPSVATAKHWERKYLAGMAALIISLLGAGTAGFLAPPLPVSIWNLLAAGATIIAVGIIARSVLITGAEPITHSGIAIGISLTIAGGVGALVKLSVSQAFVLAALIGLIILLFASRWALSLARIASPYVPTVGEPFVRDADKDLASLPMSAEAKAVAEIVGQLEKVHAARGILLGLRVGGIIAIGIGGWGALLSYNSSSSVDLRLIIGFIVASGLVIMAAATSEIDEQIHSYMLWSATLVNVMLPIVGAIAGDEILDYVFPAIGVLGVFLIISIIFSLKGGESSASPTMKFILELIESALTFTPFALSVFIFDLYGIVVSI